MTDNTERFIIMCTKANDLQTSWNPTYKDCIAIKYKNNDGYTIQHHQPTGVFDVIDMMSERRKGDYEGVYWLPTQRQLQGILMPQEDWSTFYVLMDMCMVNENDYYLHTFKSMEQFMLGIVMAGKYNKHWNEEKQDWVDMED